MPEINVKMNKENAISQVQKSVGLLVLLLMCSRLAAMLPKMKSNRACYAIYRGNFVALLHFILQQYILYFWALDEKRRTQPRIKNHA